MSRRARVDRLERSKSFAAGACPECGRDPDAPIRYKVCWEDTEEDEVSEARVSTEPCPVCGTRAQTVIDFDGIVDDPAEAREKAEYRRRIEAERAEYLRSRPDLAKLASPQEKADEQEIPDYPPWGEQGGRGDR